MRSRLVLLMAVFALASVPSFADDAAALFADPTVPPEWLEGLLIWVQTLPYVGPVLVEVFKWVGVVSAIATALSYAIQIVLALPEVVARFSGAPAAADKIKYWSDKILYWLKFFSIRNAKK